MKTHRIASELLCLLLIAVATPLLLAEDTPQPSLAKQANKTNLSVEELSKAGRAAEVAKDWTQAINIWTQLLAIQPDDVEALLGRSGAQSELGQPALGLADDRKAVELAPDNIRARNSLCWHSISAGEWGQARTACERSHALAPDIMATNINLGHTYFLQGDLATARQWYDKTIPLLESEDDLTAGPLGDFDLFIRRGWQVEASNQVRAWFADQGQQWLKVIRLNQQVLDLYQQGKYAEALPIAQQALAICEKVFGAEHSIVATGIDNLAVLYNSQGRYAEAEPLYKRALAISEKILGPEHPNTATALDNMAKLYQKMGAYDKVEPLYRRSLAIREKTLGSEHPDTASSLNNLAVLFHSTGYSAEAEPLYKRALTIYEKVLGPEHPHTAYALNNLAAIYREIGAYDRAEPLYKRALTIREKVLGPEHPDTSDSLNNLAGLYYSMEAYDKAEPLFRRSLAISEKTLGPEHPDTAVSLNNLAGLYDTMGAYDKAEPLYRRSLSVREKILGPEHPETAYTMNSLALIYSHMGAYDKAEPLYRRSLVIREKVLGPEHPDTVLTLNNIAGLYGTMGSYDKAEPLYRRSLSVREKVLGPEHPDTAYTLNDLALMYHKMGAYDKAELLYRRSLSIREKVLGPEHRNTATTLTNLAALYVTMGTYDKAEPLLKRALAIWEKTLGPEHPNTVYALINLSSLYYKMGDYDRTEPLLRRSLVVREKVLGPEHPDTANSLNNLAVFYKTMGSYDKAEPLYSRSLAIAEKTLGHEHPHTATALRNLALLYAAQGRSGESLTLMERVQESDRKQIEQVLGFASESLQTQFLATREYDFFAYLSLIWQRFPDDPKAIRNALDVWLARKGILLEAQKRIKEVLSVGDNPQAQEIFANLILIRQELAMLVLGGQGKEGPEAYQKRIVELTAQKETLEGQLSRLSQAFAQHRKTRIATTSAVASALPQGAILIEMARIKGVDFKKGEWGSSRYLAFVLSSGKNPDVSLVDLGDADNIDQQTAAFKKSLGNSKTLSDVLAKQSNDLYRLIFAPLHLGVGESRQIFLSPDGSLNLIPFEVLRDDKGRYLIETHTFHYVSAGRDIAGYGMIKEKGRKALLIGDPDFNLAAKQTDGEKEKPVTRSRQMQGLTFSRLPGTKEEVEAIAAIMGRSDSDTYTGETARESVLLRKESPRILHLATHGFFLSDQDWSSLMDEKSRGINIIGKDKLPSKKPVSIENPFLRAGLALAGANRSLAQEGTMDGVLTGEKILGLNLRGTDMVVLSACETGVGDVKNGEGVYGLRRAFTQAGAKSLVMSLWEVPDRETKELMVSFYENLQSGKVNRAEALRHAALKQREVVKARYGYDNPYYWGAFVFLGEAE
ncbi:MAG: tetratricopeptide repeat protein [Deltaproteobacteria bacterium]|nr:tetratricopeptide repeat protein [Deltaproteobacteria bacterium]